MSQLTAAWDDFLTAARRELDLLRKTPSRDFPHFTHAGRWSNLDVRHTSGWTAEGVYDHGNWTAGFSVGVGWLLWAAQPDEHLRSLLTDRLREITPRADDATTHDLGFLFFPSFALGHLLGGLSAEDLTPGMTAASTLARRSNEAGAYIQAFGPIGGARSAGSSTIDTMMNLPLLWWASSMGSDVRLQEVARRHARTSARLFFRPDGSTYHLIHFDPLSGALLRRGTYQGSSDDSSWSRGQSWAVTGFAWAFAATREIEFLRASEVAARYFVDHLPSDSIPPWDFSDTDPDAPRDASAAAIAAVGLLLLAHLHPEQTRRIEYGQKAQDILLKLHDSCANTSGPHNGILLKSCYSRPHNLGVDGAVAWGDFYYGLGLGLATGAVQCEQILGRAATGSHPGSPPNIAMEAED